MSRTSIDNVKRSGRFNSYEWNDSQAIAISTLDYLIEQYGSPDYIKTDLEGYELPVVRGLSRAVPLLSFEFAPEAIESAIGCIEHLTSLGEFKFSHTIDRDRALASPTWMQTEQACAYFTDWSSRGDMRSADIFASKISRKA